MHFALGSALAAMGLLDDAAVELKEPLRLKPDYSDAKTSLDTVRELQKHEEARK